MTDRIPTSEIFTPQEHKEILDIATEYVHKSLNFIADEMDKIKNEKHNSFVANQYLGILTQHMMRMTIGNAFVTGNEVHTVGKLYISAILDGYKIARDEESLRKQAQESKKEGTH